jgi:hypothetical protein
MLGDNKIKMMIKITNVNDVAFSFQLIEKRSFAKNLVAQDGKRAKSSLA